MTDYYPLIARAVEGLARNTGEARRALYERARAALVTQLRGVEPALSESEITKERLALEEAIRKVEGEAARKVRTEPRSDSRSEPRSGAPLLRSAADAISAPSTAATALRRERSSSTLSEMPVAARAEAQPAATTLVRQSDESTPAEAAPPSARNRLLNARNTSITRQGLKGFRNVVGEVDDLGAATAKAAQTARDTRDSYVPASPRLSQAEDLDQTSLQHRFEPQFYSDELQSGDDEPPDQHGPESFFDFQDSPMLPRAARPQPPRGTEPDEDYEKPGSRRSYRDFARLGVVLILLVGFAATVSWQWPHISGLYHFVTDLRSRPQTQSEQTPTDPKYPGRVPQDQAGQAPATSPPPNSQTLPQVAQRVVLYEEDSNNPQGRQFVGSAVWRTETVSPGPGLAPELAVRADIEIPERRMTVTWSLRRNTDKALPASHTIEIMFNLPADFPGGGVANVPGVLMKQAEQARGTPLSGLAVKVTNGFFLIGLSAIDADMQRNVQLLKERSWFDIPIVYSNGGRAILAMEKGSPGERAFSDAFAAWAK
jgi:hypothetical protein